MCGNRKTFDHWNETLQFIFYDNKINNRLGVILGHNNLFKLCRVMVKAGQADETEIDNEFNDVRKHVAIQE